MAQHVTVSLIAGRPRDQESNEGRKRWHTTTPLSITVTLDNHSCPVSSCGLSSKCVMVPADDA